MARQSAERKLVEQMSDALCDIRFEPTLFAHLVAVGDKETQKRFIQLFANTMELIAINYDYGNFSGDNYRFVRFAAKVRDLIESGEFSDEGPTIDDEIDG